MAKQRSSRLRLLRIPAALVVVSAAVLWLGTSGRLTRYPFVHRLGGKESIIQEPMTQVPANYSRICFSFTEAPQTIRNAILAEYGDKWVKSIDDDQYLVMRQSSKLGSDAIVFRQFKRVAADKVTCYVDVPRNPTFVESAISWLQLRLSKGKRPKVVIPMITYPSGNWTVSKAKDGYEAEFVWRNLSDDNLNVTLDYFYYGGYESREALPIGASIKPWTTLTRKLTFAGGPPDTTFDIVFSRSEKTPAGSYSMMGGGASIDPAASLVGSDPMVHDIILRSPREDRAIEVRNVRVSLTGKVRAHIAESFILKPGDTRRLPLQGVKITIANRPNLLVIGEGRLLPNKRWRRFRVTP